MTVRLSLPPSLFVEKAGSWNLKVGRNVDRVVGEVWDFMFSEDLDWAVFQESRQYSRALEVKFSGTRYIVITAPLADGPGRDCTVIVRAKLLESAGHLFSLGAIEWERKPGRPGLHPERKARAVSVFGLKVLDVHMPPGPFGPRFPLRRLAYTMAGRKIARIARRWASNDRAFVLVGDWNKSTTEDGSWEWPSPEWIADSAGARITGNAIDYLIHYGCEIAHYQRLVGFGHSDHWPITFVVKRDPEFFTTQGES
jgi:hypothetical protein